MCLTTMIVLILLTSMSGHAYSVLTHEQVVDLVWKDQIVPLLRQRFPQATDEDLRKAHAYAYGGSVLQDMGYYPFGNKFFSDLTHYVRTGDFVVALIHDSSDINEYACALGALAHYVSDNTGHPTINRAVSLEFPKLRKKFGDSVTYEDNPKAHIRTEFGFDMVQVAKNRYTNDRFHDFIGFEIAKPLLDRSFLEIYGLKMTDVVDKEDLAIGTFRRAVSTVIPEMTRVALVARKKEMVKEDPTFNKTKFLYLLSRGNYEKEWGKGYRRPGTGTRILAFFLRIVPKVGPFSALQFKIPSTHTEDMYIKSVNDTVADYRGFLRKVQTPELHLEDRDCDTGKDASFGEYRRSDATYSKLLDKLSEHNFDQVSPELRANILQYYAGAPGRISATKNTKLETKTEDQLQQLRRLSVKAVNETERTDHQ
jgi:Zinc dependent phospholipase C